MAWRQYILTLQRTGFVRCPVLPWSDEASGAMDVWRWMLALCFFTASCKGIIFGVGESGGTTESLKYTCKTYGSGVVQAFRSSPFYVRSNCPFTFARFTHNRVECDISIRRGQNGLLDLIEIIINRVKTVVQNGTIRVEKKSISLPYDHTYQHIFQYGIYTRLKSSLLPLTVTWHTVVGGLDSVWVELEQELSSDLSGLCSIQNSVSNLQEVVRKCLIADVTCRVQDLQPRFNPVNCIYCCSSSQGKVNLLQHKSCCFKILENILFSFCMTNSFFVLYLNL
uniref:Uncharacterized protein n=1 Tax=Fundulus heteroclitus TaxID=8078 RepID=A0A3Q2Q887_FUNHE